MVSSISTNGQGPSEDGTSFLQGGPRSKTHPISGLLDRRGDYASANAHAEIIHLTCNGARRPGQEFFFIDCDSVRAHLFVGARTEFVSFASVHLCHPNLLGLFPSINSV
jgi:hypothetical protein